MLNEAACRVADDKPHGDTHLEGSYTHAAAHARLQRLGGDLLNAQQADRINCFQATSADFRRAKTPAVTRGDASRGRDDHERTRVFR